MKNRRIILREENEQLNFTDKSLQFAAKEGCIKGGKEVDLGTGIGYAYEKAPSKIAGFNAYVFAPKPNEDQTKLIAKYSKDNGQTFDETKTTLVPCPTYAKLKQEATNEQTTTYVNDLKAAKYPIKLYSEVTGANTVDGTYKAMSLYDYFKQNPKLKETFPQVEMYFSSRPDVLVWVYQGESGRTIQNAEVQALLDSGQGWRVCTAKDQASGFAQVIIWKGTDGKPKNVDGNYYCRDVRTTEGLKTETEKFRQLWKNVQDKGTSVESCRPLIDEYHRLAFSASKIPQEDINRGREYITECWKNDLVMDKINSLFRGKKNDFTTKINNLRTKINTDARNPENNRDWSLSLGGKGDSGSGSVMESTLKRIIRENLIEISESKKKILAEEYKIINNRLSIIKEGGIPKNTIEEKKVIKAIVSEMFYLHQQGYNPHLISEQLFDIVGALLGKKTQDSIFQTFKEYAVDWIIRNLTPMDPDGWVSSVIETTIADIPIGDWFSGKVFKCDYITDKLSLGLVEGTVKKVMGEKGLSGGFYDLVRNRIVESLRDTEFGSKVENFLGELICPGWDKISTKMDSTAETIKDKALS